ncbi:MAG: class I SAM-dependent methyltransferase [Anaerolineae bacterium]|nr:class I SAM-dependent methyltransferase [Gemmatimonadaceae bacterium]
MPAANSPLKNAVQAHWEAQPCGTRDLPPEDRRRFFAEIERERYAWEPYIPGFARFERGANQRVLEIGVGAGSDFINWVRNGAEATGVDLTESGVSLTRERLLLENLRAKVQQGDAEQLPFADNSFDIVYSWGVLHHSPDTARAVREVFRVLRPEGTALVMIYHSRSWVGFMLWLLHCLAKGRPWKGPRWAIYNHLESPGTKAYTRREAANLFEGFSRVQVRTLLSHGDQLLMRPAAKYQSMAHRLIWRLYPRWLVRRLGNRFGINLLIEAIK